VSEFRASSARSGQKGRQGTPRTPVEGRTPPPATPSTGENEPSGPRFERGYGLPTAVLDVHEAAAYLAIDEGTVYRLARTGELPHTRIGRAVRFRVVDLDRYLKEHTGTTYRTHRKADRTG